MILILFVGDGEAATQQQFLIWSGAFSTSKLRRQAGTGHASTTRGKAIKRKFDSLSFKRSMQEQSAWSPLSTAIVLLDEEDCELREARERDRMERPPFPTAFGEADPHGEAWLLDDPTAIRDALELDPEVEIPTLSKTGESQIGCE